jgi:hypothetical protein
LNANHARAMGPMPQTPMGKLEARQRHHTRANPAQIFGKKALAASIAVGLVYTFVGHVQLYVTA